jgi:hypothetical protein
MLDETARNYSPLSHFSPRFAGFDASSGWLYQVAEPGQLHEIVVLIHFPANGALYLTIAIA